MSSAFWRLQAYLLIRSTNKNRSISVLFVQVLVLLSVYKRSYTHLCRIVYTTSQHVYLFTATEITGSRIRVLIAYNSMQSITKAHSHRHPTAEKTLCLQIIHQSSEGTNNCLFQIHQRQKMNIVNIWHTRLLRRQTDIPSPLCSGTFKLGRSII